MGSPASSMARVVRGAWAARHAARLASAAASRAARSAAAPRPRAAAARSLTAAASRAARLASAAAWRAAREASFVADLLDDVDDRPRRRRSSLQARDPVPGVDVTAKDLESDEAVWALYENWCKAFNKERSLDEMAHRFRVFKQCAEDVHDLNQISRDDDPDEEQMRLDESCDGFDAQEIAWLKNEATGRILAFHHELLDEMRIDYPPPNQSP